MVHKHTEKHKYHKIHFSGFMTFHTISNKFCIICYYAYFGLFMQISLVDYSTYLHSSYKLVAHFVLSLDLF